MLPAGAGQDAHAGPTRDRDGIGRDRLIVNCGYAGDDPRWQLAMRSTAASFRGDDRRRQRRRALDERGGFRHGRLRTAPSAGRPRRCLDRGGPRRLRPALLQPLPPTPLHRRAWRGPARRRSRPRRATGSSSATCPRVDAQLEGGGGEDTAVRELRRLRLPLSSRRRPSPSTTASTSARRIPRRARSSSPPLRRLRHPDQVGAAAGGRGA